MEQKNVIEAALFMGTKPLSLVELARITGLGSLGTLKQLLEDLRTEYAERGVQVVETPQGWSMQVSQEMLPRVAHLTPYSDLSEGCKRTLALIVYKEPLAQSELIRIQGNKAYAYVKKLKRMELIKTEKKGRTKMLSLTKEFENYFGQEKSKVREQLAKEFEGYERKEGPEEQPE